MIQRLHVKLIQHSQQLIFKCKYMQMHDCVCVIAWQHGCLGARWLSTTLQLSQKASFGFPRHVPSLLCLPLLPPLYVIPMYTRSLATCSNSVHPCFSWICFLFRKADLTPGCVLFLQQAAVTSISCSETGTIKGWITCGSLSLHILSKLPHELQAGPSQH